MRKKTLLEELLGDDIEGPYIDIPETDDDYVTLMKGDSGFFYRIRGPVIKSIYNLLIDYDLVENERDELLYAISHTKTMKRFLSRQKGNKDVN